MRQKIVAGNWKMNTSIDKGIELAQEICSVEESFDNKVKVIIAPPYTHLYSISEVVKGSVVSLSSQNCAANEKGAYTGEISPEMLLSANVEYVILGHSERRQYYAETDEILLKKVYLALNNNLKPIFCIGELLDQREAGKHFNVLESQLKNTILQLTEEQIRNIVIAYEPIWAIGTGKVALPEQAQEVHAFIRNLLEAKYGEKLSQDISILYGGSCKPSNAKELFSQTDIDGGLIGGAALKASDFVGIINSFE